MTQDPASNQILAVDDAETALAISHDLAIPLHRVQATAQRLQILLAVEGQLAGQLLPRHGHTGTIELPQNVLPARDRIIVFFGLSNPIRVVCFFCFITSTSSQK